MLTVNEAFKKFKSRLELNEKEQANASKRHNEVRELVRSKFSIDNDFLTGSYKRHTKTKPLKDIDIFFVLNEKHSQYKNELPSNILNDFYKVLVDKYGEKAVKKQRRSIGVDFGVVIDADDNTDYRVVSVDVVPAFTSGENYEIPDDNEKKWIKTNPKIHADKATAAHQAWILYRSAPIPQAVTERQQPRM